MEKEHSCKYPGIHVSVDNNKKNIDKIDCKVDNLVERTTVIEQSSKSAHHRLDAMERHTEAVFKLSMSVENMASKIESFIEMQKDHDRRLDILERQPGQLALSRWHLIIGGIITGAVGFLISTLLK